jgi:hypothetical protein
MASGAIILRLDHLPIAPSDPELILDCLLPISEAFSIGLESNLLLDLLSERRFAILLSDVLASATDSDVAWTAVEVISYLSCLPIAHPLTRELCTVEVHDSLLMIIEQGSPLWDALTPQSRHSGRFGELQELAIGTLCNLLAVSKEMCEYCFRQSRFPGICQALLESTDSDPRIVIAAIETIATVIGVLESSLLLDDLLPWVGIFVGALTINNNPHPTAIAGLCAAIHACSNIGDFLAHGRCFVVIVGFIDDGNPWLLNSIVQFVGCVLELCSEWIRAELVRVIDWDEWAGIGASEDDDLVVVWAVQTAQIFANNPLLMVKSGCEQTIFQMVDCSITRSFEVRKIAISGFMRFSDELPVSVLGECAKQGLIANIVDLFDAIDQDEDAVALLTRLLKACVPFCITGEVDDQLQQLEQLACHMERLSDCLQALDEARELG